MMRFADTRVAAPLRVLPVAPAEGVGLRTLFSLQKWSDRVASRSILREIPLRRRSHPTATALRHCIGLALTHHLVRKFVGRK